MQREENKNNELERNVMSGIEVVIGNFLMLSIIFIIFVIVGKFIYYIIKIPVMLLLCLLCGVGLVFMSIIAIIVQITKKITKQ